MSATIQGTITYICTKHWIMRFMYCIALFIMTQTSFSQMEALSIMEYEGKQGENTLLIDVRTPREYAAGHLEGAVNIDWYAVDFETLFEDIPKEKTIYVYCKMGGRSAKAQAKLREMGYEHVIDLTGGYEAWLQRESRP